MNSNLTNDDGRGFTLTELLVVIAIFGLLMAFVIANLQTSKSRSRDQRRVSDVQQLQLALETFFEKNHYYPEELSTLVGEYIGEIPPVPDGTSQTEYSYTGTGTVQDKCSGYHLGAVLENSIPPLEEDLDWNARGNGCVFPPIGADFNGKNETCGAAGTSTDMCYDVIEQ